ncbi:MAG: DUF697 domain-containing protein [Myxococcales bacterium]|nr:DUF697 domain-containing protein [Myxococcales bacterium]
MSWLDTLAEIRKTDWSKVPDPEREATALEVIQMASYAAATAAVVPLPMVDIALLLPVHTAMVMTVGHVHGRNVSDAEAKRVALELGAVAGLTLAGRAALSVLRKILLPGLGGVLAAPASFAVTYALGRAANAYFSDPELSREDLKKVFSDAFKEGKSSYREQKHEDIKDVEGEGSSADEASVSPPGSTPDGGEDGTTSKSRTKKRSL